MKKFGTFGGVFTPSILTILGVIMYMRLPLIVGQAGLYMAIGIILLAHVVSITTGLSISSIATDKKVRGGGSYYMISRSLGLPIGGALGLALFVGLSFGVSLYIIGFSESFNRFWGFGDSVDYIRVTGTVTLLLVTVLTFISSSLAVKSQYFIMGAIVLSLVSVFLGHSPSVSDAPALLPSENAPSLIILFGVFFPAVTGFEAGVSMSGDLKEPKKSIPIGTITAIGVGLIVYIFMAVFLSYRVSPKHLIENQNILLEISIFPPLVIAGVWSATISSAIGSILGAPRILQAISSDRIVHKFFSRGHGDANEPRRALMLTFIIAEAGILIGELDIIARVVSVFFLITYGFLNFSCFIESWTGSDFRPSFKVYKIISVIGAVSCLFIMVELDLIAAAGGTLIMIALFFYLKRRELAVESGDVWGGVWSSIVRKGLSKLSRKSTHSRNWRPNIVLFSGGTEARPYLIEFGKWAVGKLGMLSNFDLIENSTSKVLFPKSKQSIEVKENFDGVFVRRQECSDIYEGIKTITQTYGFSGIEPNTVLMGWPSNPRSPEKFADLLRVLNDLDFNLLLLKYNSLKEFGNKRQIDIWWRGSGNNGSLTLSFMKFFIASGDWLGAQVRFLIVTEESLLIDAIRKNMDVLLEELRMAATVKIINNAARQTPFSDILQKESTDTDLTILGLPTIQSSENDVFFNRLSDLIRPLGTVLLLKASSYFQEIVTGFEPQTVEYSNAETGERDFAKDIPKQTLPENPLLRNNAKEFNEIFEKNFLRYFDDYLSPVRSANNYFGDSMGKAANAAFASLDKALKGASIQRQKKNVAKIQGEFFFQLKRFVSEFKSKQLIDQKNYLQEGTSWLETRREELLKNAPRSLKIVYGRSKFDIGADDGFSLKALKLWKRCQTTLSPKWGAVKVPFKQTLLLRLEGMERPRAWSKLSRLGVDHYYLILEIRKFMRSVRDSLDFLENRFLNEQLYREMIAEETLKITQRLAELKTFNERIFHNYGKSMFLERRNVSNAIFARLSSLKFDKRLKRRGEKKLSELSRKRVEGFPELWFQNQSGLFAIIELDMELAIFQRRIKIIIRKIKQELRLAIENGLLKKIDQLIGALESYEFTGSDILDLPEIHLKYEDKSPVYPQETIEAIMEELKPALDNLPRSINAISSASLNNLEKGAFEEIEVVSVSLRELAEFFIYSKFIEKLREHMESLETKLKKTNDEIQDAVRFIHFSVNLKDEQRLIEELKEDIQKGKARILGEKAKVETCRGDLVEAIDSYLKDVIESVDPYLITGSSHDLNRYIKKRESQKTISKFSEKRKKIQLRINELLVRLVYKLSEGILLFRRLLKSEDKSDVEVETALNSAFRFMPANSVMETLPFHYKQLFLGEHFPNADFWAGRKDELAQAEIVVKNYRSGFNGALMVTGERCSGKSHFSNFAAEQFFSSGKIYQLLPPVTACSEKKAFHRRLEETLKLSGNKEDIVNFIPRNSVIVLHDLELWWERKDGGLETLDYILELIELFGQRCFFILNMSAHSLRFIRKLKNIDDFLLGVIDCGAFNAKELKDIIMLRHKATGLKFRLGKHLEDDLSNMRLARLFKKYFDSSKGHPGTALKSWICNIRKVNGNILEIVHPGRSTADFSRRLKSDWIAPLTLFALHKRLSCHQIASLMEEDEVSARQRLDTLKRAGLLEEKSGWLRINPFIEARLTKTFVEMEAL